MTVFFEIKALQFSYPASQPSESREVLRGVDLCIADGEFVAVVGANGSGKSTLARHLNGLLLPSAGRVRVAGMDTREPQNHARIRNLVGMVFQFPEDQIVSTVAEEDVAFGPANLGLPREEIQKRVDESLARVGLMDYRFRPPHMLSAGQLQRLALAGVLALRPRCIVFDEATTMLDPLGRRMVMDLMHDLNKDGITVVFITHHMEEAAQAKRMLVMQQGNIVMDGSPEHIFAKQADLTACGLSLPLVTSLAKDLARVFPGMGQGIYREKDLFSALSGPKELQRIMEPTSNPLPSVVSQIDVEHLAHTYMKGTPLQHLAIEDVSFRVKQGDSCGFMGHTGSGKSTVLQHLNGILRPQAGTVRVGEFLLNDLSVERKKVCQLAGLMFQNPEMQFFETYVGDEIAYGVRQFGSKKLLAEQVRWAMEAVGLDFQQMKDRAVYNLSGGERRKVALASVLAWEPEILLLDEPTAGLDPVSRQEIVKRLKELAEMKVTLVLSSHQMEDIAALVSSAVIFSKGRDIIQGTLGEIFQQDELLAGVGLEPPLVVRVRNQLCNLGWSISELAITPERLLQSLGVANE